ncbi:RNA polymerase sigma factor [Piscinibacter defluvii]|uniref:RNA polymerase sigma factor n=1 Tax=Piscinibacter defluvii TaxID=1796922 RepID=UPI000FDEBBF0|nr:sigma-70 family RNA polymerase sigma factor [Piscinibacter defluvii]
MSEGDDPGAENARLVARCRAGDGAAWRALVQRYQRLVYAIVTRTGLDGHTAADVFQTVFQRLHEQLPRLAQPERLQAWIVTTARREALREIRRVGRHETLDAGDDEDGDRPALHERLADDAPRAEEQLAELQSLDLLRHSLDRLDERCRELLLLTFRDDDDALDYDSIAERMGMPRGSLGPTRSRCLGKLRKLYDAAGVRP